MAADYHWLYDDLALRRGTSTPGVRTALAGLERGSRVADVACGVGVDAAALARRGFEVTATDASAAMVQATRERLREEGLAAEVSVVSWEELPAKLSSGTFDVVLCVGSSIAHARGREERVAAVRSFERLLAPDGVLVIDTHDWETIDDWADEMIDTEPSVLERGGVTCRRRSRWRLGRDEDGPHRLEVTFELDDGRAVDRHSYVLSAHPFSAGELRDEVRSTGLSVVSVDRGIDPDRYTLVAAKRGSGSGPIGRASR